MRMIREVQEYEFGLKGVFFSSLFNKDIRVVIEKDSPVEFAEICVNYFDSLNDEIIEKLCISSISYCNDFLKNIGETEKEFENTRDVLKFIYPNTLIVPLPEQGTKSVVHIEFDCEWEEEHGMEIVIRDDKLLYLGPFHDEYEWYDYENKEKKESNYA